MAVWSAGARGRPPEHRCNSGIVHKANLYVIEQLVAAHLLTAGAVAKSEGVKFGISVINGCLLQGSPEP